MVEESAPFYSLSTIGKTPQTTLRLLQT